MSKSNFINNKILYWKVSPISNIIYSLKIQKSSYLEIQLIVLSIIPVFITNTLLIFVGLWILNCLKWGEERLLLLQVSSLACKVLKNHHSMLPTSKMLGEKYTWIIREVSSQGKMLAPKLERQVNIQNKNLPKAKTY